MQNVDQFFTSALQQERYRTQKSGACSVAGESKSRMANSICARAHVVIGSLNYVIPLLRVQCLTALVQRYVYKCPVYLQ